MWRNISSGHARLPHKKILPKMRQRNPTPKPKPTKQKTMAKEAPKMKKKCLIPNCKNTTKAKSGLCKQCAQANRKIGIRREAQVSRHFKNTNGAFKQ
jgi:hypothetical protein